MRSVVAVRVASIPGYDLSQKLSRRRCIKVRVRLVCFGVEILARAPYGTALDRETSALVGQGNRGTWVASWSQG